MKAFPGQAGVAHAQELFIQDTDRANQAIHINLPTTTLAKILDYEGAEKYISYKTFDVKSKSMRDMLLGSDDAEGLLDKGLQYLADSQVVIGSQLLRLEQSERNIITQQENTQASESVIRDADMVKAITDYTKGNIILQASQTMLAQANQNVGEVLSLLR